MDHEFGEVKTILLAEDDPGDVELVMRALGENDLAKKVVSVGDGAMALDYLYRRGEFKTRAGGNPILVLLDLKMPKVGGLKVLNTMKGDENLKAIPVVLFSSSSETADLTECYRQGANAYVVKPMDFHEFMKAVKQIGIFWATINKPPPAVSGKETDININSNGVEAGDTVRQENTSPNPASRR